MYKYNKDAKYEAGSHYNPKTMVFNKLDVAVSETLIFEVKVPNPLKSYLNPPIKDDATAKAWLSNPIQFYQNHLNFAIHCATTGCGVSYADHMNHPNQLVKSVYRFHVYFQFRRVLSELQVPLPTDSNFNPFNSRINMKAYERLCNEFNIDSKTAFRQAQDKNHGMGTLYLWGVHRRYNYDWWPPNTSFSCGARVVLGSIEQIHMYAWTTFILDKSEGLTRPGLERINDSVQTYVWCLLGAQAQTRSSIIGGTGFDAQKQFLANLEDSINSAVDLPSSIKHYQDVLHYARSKVDFAIGHGLYMLPSNMQLQIGTITNYNNNIIIAGDDVLLGKNESVNNTTAATSVVTTTSVVSPTQETRERTTTTSEQRKKTIIIPLVRDSHYDEITALTSILVLSGLAYLYFRKKKTNN